MTSSRFWIATTAGTVVAFLLAFLFYGVLLMDFFTEASGAVPGAMKETPVFWLLFLGEFVITAFVTLMMVWKGVTNATEGAGVGAIIWLMLGVGFSFVFLGAWNITTPIAATVDTGVGVIRGTISGAVIGWLLGRGADEPAVSEPEAARV